MEQRRNTILKFLSAFPFLTKETLTGDLAVATHAVGLATGSQGCDTPAVPLPQKTPPLCAHLLLRVKLRAGDLLESPVAEPEHGAAAPPSPAAHLRRPTELTAAPFFLVDERCGAPFARDAIGASPSRRRGPLLRGPSWSRCRASPPRWEGAHHSLPLEARLRRHRRDAVVHVEVRRGPPSSPSLAPSHRAPATALCAAPRPAKPPRRPGFVRRLRSA
jgi:hypothetical protein